MVYLSKRAEWFYWPFLLLMCIALAGWFGYSLKQEREQSANKEMEYRTAVETYRTTLNDFYTVRQLELESTGMLLNNVFVNDLYGNRYRLKQLIDGKTLVFRFWQGSCAPCLEDNLSSIKKLDSVPLILLANFSSTSSFKRFAKRKELSNIFMVESNKLLNSNKLEDLQYLHYFIIDNSLKTSKLIVPLMSDHKYAKAYLRSVPSFL